MNDYIKVDTKRSGNFLIQYLTMVVITKEAIYIDYFENGNNMRIDIRDTDGKITRFLGEVVFFEDGVTVVDFMKLLNEYEAELNVAFDHSLGGYGFAEFYAELSDEAEADDLLRCVEFAHEPSIEDSLLMCDTRFGAIGTDESAEDKEELQQFSVEISPISTYKNLEIVLNTLYRLTHTELIDGEEVETLLLEVHKPFKLYDIIHSFLYEISYYGNKACRLAAFEEFKNHMIARMKDAGDLKGPELARQIEKEIMELESELEGSVADEDYENSARLRDRISSLKKERVKNGTNPANGDITN